MIEEITGNEKECIVTGCNRLAFFGNYCPYHSDNKIITKYLQDANKVKALTKKAEKAIALKIDYSFYEKQALYKKYVGLNQKFRRIKKKEELEHEIKARKPPSLEDYKQRERHNGLQGFRQARELLL